MDEQTLVDRLRQQDPTALEAFYDQFRTPVLSIALRLVHDRWDAEEVLQDVVWTVYRKIGTYRGDSSFRGWVFRIAQNSARMLLRKRKRVPTPIEDTAIEAIVTGDPDVDVDLRPDAILAQSAAAGRMQSVFDDLDPVNRQIFVATHLSGHTPTEVASVMDLSVSAVKARLHRVKVALRSAAHAVA